uniref:Eclosion hormone n=1 Tax=Triatoma infestans TaxID=30076 RepID=A0A161MNB2_TRIIF
MPSNCAQCKRMLGQFFKGPICAETCLKSFGFVTPDCNKPVSLTAYLRNTY